MHLTEALARLHLEAKPPRERDLRERFFSSLDLGARAEAEALYSQCDGGAIPRLGSRIYSLAEGSRLIPWYREQLGFNVLPFFVADNSESDPCVVGVAPPLRGHVFQLCHDLPSRILAPSISSFLEVLAAWPADDPLWLEDTAFVYPRDLSPADQETVEALIGRSVSELEIEYEPQLLMALALSMMTDEACLARVRDLDHPDHNARYEISARLKSIGTPAAEEILLRSDEQLRAFVAQAIQVLTRQGFEAISRNGTDIRIGSKADIALNVPVFFDHRNDVDCWDYLVEGARRLSGLKR